MDFVSLGKELYAASGKRIGNEAFFTSQGEFKTLWFPILFLSSSDPKETAFRRYISDWIRRQGEFSVDTRFELCDENISWAEKEGMPVFVVRAKLIVSFWPRSPRGDMDLLIEAQKKKRNPF